MNRVLGRRLLVSQFTGRMEFYPAVPQAATAKKIAAPPYRHTRKREKKKDATLPPGGEWWEWVWWSASPSAQPLSGLLSPRDDARPPWPQVSAARPLWRPLWPTDRRGPPSPACAPGRRFVLRCGETESQSLICLLNRGWTNLLSISAVCCKEKKWNSRPAEGGRQFYVDAAAKMTACPQTAQLARPQLGQRPGWRWPNRVFSHQIIFHLRQRLIKTPPAAIHPHSANCRKISVGELCRWDEFCVGGRTPIQRTREPGHRWWKSSTVQLFPV